MKDSRIDQAVVFGNDHTNSLGVVQALGKEGVNITAVLWGKSTGIVGSSRFAKKVLRADNAQQCIELMLTHCKGNQPVVIIPCTDEAAVVLEENADRLRTHFLFQSAGAMSIRKLEDKQLQTQIAKRSGLHTPYSLEISEVDQIPEQMIFPCLIKPVMSTEGFTSDILVCENMQQLRAQAQRILPRTKRLLLQQYIEKTSDYGVVGCRLRNGEVIIPDIIDRPRIYPPKTGLGTLYVLELLQDRALQEGIKRYVEEIDYVGLFSLEFAKSIKDGQYYFIEANFRNDGENPCLEKAGLNIVYAHYCDLLGEPMSIGPIRPVTVISEMRHLNSMRAGYISKRQWIKDMKDADSFMSYYKQDYKPFLRLCWNLVANKLKRIIRK